MKLSNSRRLQGLQGDEDVVGADETGSSSAQVRRLLSEAEVKDLMDPVLEKLYNVPDQINITAAKPTGGGTWNLTFDIVMPPGVSKNDSAVTAMITSVKQKTENLKDANSTEMQTMLGELQVQVTKQNLAAKITVPAAADIAASVVVITVPVAVEKDVIIKVIIPAPAPVPVPSTTTDTTTFVKPAGTRSFGLRARLHATAAGMLCIVLLAFPLSRP